MKREYTMPQNDKLYVPASPGDTITAEAWNKIQEEIHDDIRATAQAAAMAVTKVERAGDAEKLDGKTPEQLAQAIAEKVLALLQDKRRYLLAFKVLQVGETKKIEHGFGDPPVVDVYQLDYFRVVCSEDDGVYPAWATFYLYHSSEKKIRHAKGDGFEKGVVDIEPKEQPIYKIPFHRMLARYGVEYSSTNSLGDLETEFWQAFLSGNNDEFDEEQYCHSPWFQRCCREAKTSVRELKENGDWDELIFQMRPRKTINYATAPPPQALVAADGPLPAFPQRVKAPAPVPAPNQIEVAQLDLDTVGLTLLAQPVYPQTQLDGLVAQLGEEVRNELKVMVVLKS